MGWGTSVQTVGFPPADGSGKIRQRIGEVGFYVEGEEKSNGWKREGRKARTWKERQDPG